MARQRDSYAVFALWTSRLPSVARRSAADEAFVQNAAVLLDADLELGSTLGRLCMKHVIEDQITSVSLRWHAPSNTSTTMCVRSSRRCVVHPSSTNRGAALPELTLRLCTLDTFMCPIVVYVYLCMCVHVRGAWQTLRIPLFLRHF